LAVQDRAEARWFPVGGFGGSGGDAGIVNAAIGAASGQPVHQQQGRSKSAVYVASIGGGGGDGAMNISRGISTEGRSWLASAAAAAAAGSGATTATVDATCTSGYH
jgi:hypothetical protein